MSRKLLVVALVLGLAASACASKVAGSRPVRTVFLPQTIDSIDDVGRGDALTLDKDGQPYLTYVGLLPILPPGQFPPARPVTAPALPAVLTSNLTNGIWNHGDIVQTDIRVDLAHQKPLPVTTSDRTAVAIDSKGAHHVVWTQINGLFYSDDTKSPGTWAAPSRVTSDYAFGPSITVDSKDVPWISFYTAAGLQVATPKGKGWKVQQVAAIPICATCPPTMTAIRFTPQGLGVAYADSGTNTPMLARLSGAKWSTEPIDQGGGGFGLSMTLDKDGNVHVAFISPDGTVFHAESDGGAPFGAPSKVGSFKVTDPVADLVGGTAIAVDSKGTHYVAWADPEANRLRLATSPDGKTFTPIATPGAQTGEFPSAAVDSGGKLYLAWYDAFDQDLMVGTYPEKLSGEALANPSPSSTISTSAPSSGPPVTCKPSATNLCVTAQNIAFDVNKLTAPANKPFTIFFDNRDVSTMHNVDIYTSSSATTHVAGANGLGNTITGPMTTTYHIQPLKAGTYYFQCDVHTQMNGTLVVK